jgi:hypothetical protein
MNIKFIDENLDGQNGLSRYVSPESGWRKEIETYDYCVYTDRKCFSDNIDTTKTNFAWIIEPPIVNGENYVYIVEKSKNFKYVFSYIKSLGDKIENFVFIPHGGTWLRNEDINIWGKNKKISFIYSDKTWNSGHRFRHQIANSLKDTDIDFYGTGCNKKIEYKIEGLKDYMFSIVIENSQEEDYFTEKILDCFLSGTIPIYFGTKNISKYFNSNGFFSFNTFDELQNILQNLNEETYHSLKNYVQENFEIAKSFIHPEHKINEYIKRNG